MALMAVKGHAYTRFRGLGFPEFGNDLKSFIIFLKSKSTCHFVEALEEVDFEAFRGVIGHFLAKIDGFIDDFSTKEELLHFLNVPNSENVKLLLGKEKTDKIVDRTLAKIGDFVEEITDFEKCTKFLQEVQTSVIPIVLEK